jgi:thioredoxin 1
MKKGNILFLTLLIFTILAFPYQAAFSASSSDRRFPKEIASAPLPKLLDFGRGKCIPCKAMAPILKELSEEYKDRVIIKVIEIDQESELTKANRIRLIPTQIFFDAKNKEVLRHEGFMSKDDIKKVFQKMGIQ